VVNHANGSEELFKALGRKRVVLAFPGAAGSIRRADLSPRFLGSSIRVVAMFKEA